MGNAGGALIADEIPWMNKPYSISLTLPPLAVVILQLEHDV
jgi:1,4-alpha-glucan branching enzyme